MQPTDELRTRLRAWISERIAPDGSDADTNFLDSDLDELIERCRSLEETAWRAWMQKAGWVLEGKTLVLEKSIGSERLKLASPLDLSKQFREMADYYYSLIPPDLAPGGTQEQTSRVFSMQPDPDLSPTRPAIDDLSRLIPQ